MGPVPPRLRAVVYAVVGFVSEITFSAIHDRARGRRVSLRTSSWMLPIYALILPLFEPVHNRLRGRPPWLRAACYATGFLAVEYASGYALRRATGRAPWDYSEARWNVDGLVRPDYAALWAAAGLALEPLHDRLDASSWPW